MSSLDDLLVYTRLQVYIAIIVSFSIGMANMIFDITIFIRKSNLRNSKYMPTDMWKFLTWFYALAAGFTDKFLPGRYYGEL